MNDQRQLHANPQRVLSALMGLHRAYPLERRILHEACDATRETYLAVLLRWLQTASAPTPDGLDPEALDELIALDAVFVVEGRIACPPFCPGPTDIQVHFPHETLYTLSALDALALPRALKAAARIETHCAMSGEPIVISLAENGELHATVLDAAVVGFQKVAENVDRYALDLAPGIRFVQPEHAGPLRQTLTLGEAVAVSNAFYAFQRKLAQG